MKPITFVEPVTLAEARAALAGGSARLMAGGSDLLGELKEGIVAYDRLVSLASVQGMSSIEQQPDGLHIGALVTLNELEYSSELEGPYRVLAEAARGVATPEIRNQGTLGGNLCQRPRCLHYRSALVDCLRKGGDTCPAVESPYQN
jgi:xanthine dehydrogenase YagS FAD-binding subunit